MLDPKKRSPLPWRPVEGKPWYARHGARSDPQRQNPMTWRLYADPSASSSTGHAVVVSAGNILLLLLGGEGEVGGGGPGALAPGAAGGHAARLSLRPRDRRAPLHRGGAAGRRRRIAPQCFRDLLTSGWRELVANWPPSRALL